MTAPRETFATFPFEEAIAERARRLGVDLPREGVEALAAHARAVVRANERLHLTSIVEPAEFLERHVGESLEGAAMLPAEISGTLLDLGSGNGYPGLPLAVARPGLAVVLAEASTRKAKFLEDFLAGAARDSRFSNVRVVARHVQRASDLEDLGPLRALATRAAGGWGKVCPRLVRALSEEGVLLLWAGDEVEAIRKRVAWKRYRLLDSRALPGRERSHVWLFGKQPPDFAEAPGASGGAMDPR